MKRRDWSSQQKFQIVLEGLKGGASISEVCHRHEITQAQYYKWRDTVLGGADRLFSGDPDKEKERMRKKIDRLNQHIGELTVELKKTEALL